MSILRKKPIPKTPDESKLTRNLTTFDLVFLGVGAIVGTGIFIATGQGAQAWAGPGLSLSFLIAAFAVMLSGLIFAEYASRIQAIGGPYAYLYSVFGEFFGWLGGFFVIVEFVLAGSSVATGWSGYVRGFLGDIGIHLPRLISSASNFEDGSFGFDLIAMVVAFIVTVWVAQDAKEVLRFNSVIVIIKLAVIVLFILVGVFFIKPENWMPFMPYGFIGSENGKGVFAGAALVFFAYLGFESISMSVEEAINPKKTIPRGILLSIALTTVLYILVTVVLTGMVNYKELGVDDPVAFAMRMVHQPLVASIISIVAILTLLTVLVSMTYALSRLVYAIAKDGLLPKYLTQVNDKHHTPQNATFTAGFIGLIFAGFVPLSTLMQVVNMVTLTYLILMAIGILVLRKGEKEAPEGVFKTPLVPIVPILSVIISAYLMFQLSLLTWLIFGGLIVIGVLIYLLYGYKHSKLANVESE
ncbi:basic amino acid/polyamine antiporter, APA family [Pilibacter termitis]|uniref:Basic amino acid/polyamine antiporter, APA family n=1 Tax=Pilibacter termitis TaxID=263852 RepID=A0A1T4Q683_9ENTE|nr:amino acid permease [Pilibacter termitis]SJZ99031.1 basic amino acid/polyamine antiporter, APA family [Pilibacter termitis]